MRRPKQSARRRRKLNELSVKIQIEHSRADRAARDALDHARRAGEMLIEAKALLPHGDFMPWVARDRGA